MSENALYSPLLFVFIVVLSSTYAKEEKIVINLTGNLLAGYNQLGACTQSDQPLYTYIHAYTHTYIHAYTHTYTHTYLHTYIHTYIHTYTLLSIPKKGFSASI